MFAQDKWLIIKSSLSFKKLFSENIYWQIGRKDLIFRLYWLGAWWPKCEASHVYVAINLFFWSCFHLKITEQAYLMVMFLGMWVNMVQNVENYLFVDWKKFCDTKLCFIRETVFAAQDMHDPTCIGKYRSFKGREPRFYYFRSLGDWNKGNKVSKSCNSKRSQ